MVEHQCCEHCQGIRGGRWKLASDTLGAQPNSALALWHTTLVKEASHQKSAEGAGTPSNTLHT